MKWFVLTATTIIAISVWGVFLNIFIQGEGNSVHIAGNIAEKPVDAENQRHLLGEGELIADFVLRDKPVAFEETPSNNEGGGLITNDREVISSTNSINNPSDVKEGDGIGYGEGVSVDELLIQFSNDD
ncbi:hypothetical protein ACM26V_01915 [Salipaludibacillus sp. HK11]|uniref:hypothetical protein n=1 Tax=Salipaludibacillus sp. HK11 TaxID=3394320 RepID=UPI0039FDD563